MRTTGVDVSASCRNGGDGVASLAGVSLANVSRASASLSAVGEAQQRIERSAKQAVVHSGQSGSKHHNTRLSDTSGTALRVSYQKKQRRQTDLHQVEACQEMLECFGIEEAAVIVLSKEYSRMGVDDPEQADGKDLEGQDDRGDDRVEESCVS